MTGVRPSTAAAQSPPPRAARDTRAPRRHRRSPRRPAAPASPLHRPRASGRVPPGFDPDCLPAPPAYTGQWPLSDRHWPVPPPGPADKAPVHSARQGRPMPPAPTTARRTLRSWSRGPAGSELVADAVDRLDVNGPRRIGFQLGAQAGDVIVDGSGHRVRLDAPHLVQQLVASHDGVFT